MEQIDKVAAARVWNRVLGSQAEGELLYLAAETEAGLRQLAGLLPQWKQPLLSGAETLRKQRNCLRGLCRLGQTRCRDGFAGLEKMQTVPLLRHSYGRGLRFFRGCEARKNDPEFGPVYGVLAREIQPILRLIPEILGSMPEARPEN